MTFPIHSVLIVDDNSSVRHALHGFLSQHKEFEFIAEACNGSDAIQQANRLAPDLILMDLCMPVMNGIEAASVIRHTAPLTRIIMFTLYSEELGGTLAKAAGVDLVLSKEEGLAGLTRALAQVIVH